MVVLGFRHDAIYSAFLNKNGKPTMNCVDIMGLRALVECIFVWTLVIADEQWETLLEKQSGNKLLIKS